MKKKITVIEDDADLRGLIAMALKSAGFDVNIRSDGSDFLNVESRSSDLFIIDNNLGNVTGLELCRYLKQQETLAAVPVIIISAHPDISVLAAEAQADGTLPKPFNTRELLKKVGEYLPLKK